MYAKGFAETSQRARVRAKGPAMISAAIDAVE